MDATKKTGELDILLLQLLRDGDFSLPMFIHDMVPPGVEAMKRLKDQITYTAQKTAKGAQLRIATRSPQVVGARSPALV